jgi:hypothetical protein
MAALNELTITEAARGLRAKESLWYSACYQGQYSHQGPYRERRVEDAC